MSCTGTAYPCTSNPSLPNLEDYFCLNVDPSGTEGSLFSYPYPPKHSRIQCTCTWDMILSGHA